MATRDEHLAQAAHNELVAEALVAASHYDWAVTALFYAALHLIQAWLSQSQNPPGNHAARERVMSNSAELRGVLDSYNALRARSESARYDRHRFSAQEYADIRQTLFFSVQTHVGNLLAQETDSEPING